MFTSLAVVLTLSMAQQPSSGTDLTACQNEVTRLRAESAAAEVERQRRLPPKELFALGTANPAAEAALAPAIERLLKGTSPAAPAHTLECRTRACRLMVVETKEEQARTREWTKRLQSDEEMGDRRAGMGFHAGTPTKDPLSGVALDQKEVIIVLADPSGKRVPQPRPPEKPAVSSAPLPATAESCAAEAARLRAQLQKARDEVEAHRSPDERFLKGTPAPKVAAGLRAHILEKFPGPETASLEVECRAPVCRLLWEKGPLNWFNAFYGEPWFRREFDGMMVSRAVYFVMAPGPRADALGFLQDLVKHFESTRAMSDCEARFPTRGTLKAKFHLPKTGEDNEDGTPGRISVTYGDELAGTPLAKCLESAIASTVLAAPLPTQPVGGAVLYRQFEFPRKPKEGASHK